MFERKLSETKIKMLFEKIIKKTCSNVLVFTLLFLLFLLNSVIAAQISPANPTTNDDLVCNTDLSGSLIFKWYKNNALFTSQASNKLLSSKTSPYQEWRCEVWKLVYVPHVGQIFIKKDSSSNVVIAAQENEENPEENVEYTVSLKPKVPTVSDNLTCNVTGGIPTRYDWFRNGYYYSTTTTNILSYEKTKAKETWYCEAWKKTYIPYVGYSNIKIGASNQVTVLDNGYHVPTIPVPVYPINGQYVFSDDVTLKWNASTDEDNDDITYIIEFDETSYSTNELNYTVNNIDQGFHSWRVKAVDEYDHSSAYSDLKGFYVDSIAPTLYSFAPDNSTSKNVTVTFLTSEDAHCYYSNLSNFSISYNANGNEKEHSALIVNMSEGNNTYYFKCTDLAGVNSSVYEKTIYVDSISPLVFNITPSEETRTNNTINIFLEVSENSTCKYSFTPINQSAFNSAQSFGYGTNISKNITFGEGNITIYFMCKDNIGLFSDLNSTWFYIDTIAPSLSNFVVDNYSYESGMYILDSNFNITFNTSENATCWYSNNASSINLSVNDNEQFHWINLTLNNGDYAYFFKCQDSVGFNSSTQEINFSVDIVDPEIINFSNRTNYTSSNITLRLNLSEIGECQIFNQSFTYGSGWNMSGNGTSFEYNLTLNEGYYTYHFICKDLAGRTSAENHTSFIVDLFAPVIDIIEPKNITYNNTNIILNITTTENSSCEYGNMSFSFGSGISLNSSNGLSHWINLSSTEGYNQYSVLCKDRYDHERREIFGYTLDALKPDFSINVSKNLAEISFGDLLIINVTLNNTGSDNATGFAVHVSLYDENFVWNISSLLINNIISKLFNFTISFTGTQNLSITVDVNNNISESNESNNIYVETINATYIDLIAYNISVNDSNLTIDKPLLFSANLINNGTKNATNISVGFFVDDILKNSTIINISNMSQKTVEFEYTFNETKYYLVKISADYNNTVNETKENNNNVSKNYFVGGNGIKDILLKVSNLTENATVLWTDNAFNISAKITNNGTENATNVEVRLYINNTLYNITYVNVSANNYSLASFEVSLDQAGAYNYTVHAVNQSPLDNLSDNNATKQIYINEVVTELKVSLFSINKTDVYENNLVLFSFNVTNEGNFTKNVNVYLKRDGVIVNQTNISLENHTTQTISFAHRIDASGYITFSDSVDIAEGENNITNNVFQKDLRVYSLDEVVSDSSREIFFNTSSVSAGQNFTVYYPIQNKQSDIDFHNLRFYLELPGGYLANNNLKYLNLSGGANEILSWNVKSGANSGNITVVIEGNNTIIESKQMVVN